MDQALSFIRTRLILAFFLLYTNSANAGDWDITPRLYVAEIFSDNINLDDKNKESDLITDLSPGISIHGEGSRLRADIDYVLQSLIFLKTSDATSSYNNLNASATAEVVKDIFFLDASSIINQTIIDATKTISNNNLNNAGNRTSFYSYGLSPYIQTQFGGYASGLFRYGYNRVIYEEGVSNSTINSLDVTMSSGRKGLALVSWLVDYNYSDQQRDTAPNVLYNNGQAEARYRASSRFSLLGTAGFANNDFEDSRINLNGSYWSAGGIWQPSRYVSFEAQKGKNLESAAIGLNPGRRTSLMVRYRDRAVGLNPGKTWAGSFTHYTRHTTWDARYDETTTTQQQRLQEEGGTVFLSVDPITGEVNPDPQPGDLVVSVPQAPVESLTDEVEERKTGRATFNMRRGKTAMRLTLFNIQRLFLTSLDQQNTKGFSGSLNRRVAPRTNSTLSGSWQRIENINEGQSNNRDFWYVQTQLSRQIKRKLNGFVSYTFTQLISEDDRNNYSENRVMVGLTAFF